MKPYLTLSLGLMLAVLVQTSMAAGPHAKPGKPNKACANPSQPATLACAQAPSAVFDEQRRLWVVWAYAGHIYLNYSDDLGKTFSQPLAINRVPEAISARGENRPKIALGNNAIGRATLGKIDPGKIDPGKTTPGNNNQHIYISWTTPLKKRFTGHVRFSYSHDAGKTFSQPQTVNTDKSETGHRFDALGVNQQGEVYLAWLDKRDRDRARKAGQKYHGAALYYTWSDNGGKTFKTDRKLVDHSCECCRVAIDMDGDSAVFLWRNIYGSNTRDHALLKLKAGNQPDAVERVSYDQWQVDACPHHGPALSINRDGQYHLVWFNNATERHGLFYARRDKDGRYTQAVNFGDYQANASHADVLHIGNKVWRSWKQFDGKNETAWIQRSDNNGNSWHKPRLIMESSQADYPFLLKHQQQAYLQWHTYDQGFKLVAIE